MAMRKNALDHQKEYPQAIKAVLESFYVDVNLTGAESVEDAIELQAQLRHGRIHTQEVEVMGTRNYETHFSSVARRTNDPRNKVQEFIYQGHWHQMGFHIRLMT